ncbi:MAG: translation initiation factor IF-2 [Acidobacteria bacterium]|nr:translation initiation factor IF-2 [Acidobacteriota bacterium]
MATVRIYKVAEVLNTTSQEVMALLKQAHGIEVKSASSTIEEVVARQFVERLARQRGLTVPSAAAMFSDAPPSKSKKGGKAAEPARPAAPALPPPRLIKTHRAPQVVAEPAEPAVEAPTEVAPEPSHVETEPAPTTPAAPEPVPALAAESPGPPVATEAPAAASEPPAVAAGDTTAAPDVPSADEEADDAPAGRVVPPSLRLRVEDPSAPVVEGRATPRPRPAARPQAPPPPRPATATPPPAAEGAPAAEGGTGAAPAARTPAAAAGPAAPSAERPGTPAPPAIRSPLTQVARPSYAPTNYTGPLRTMTPATAGQSARPGIPGQRPGLAGGPRPPTPPRPVATGWRPPARPAGGRSKTRSHTRDPRVAPASYAPSAPPPITRSITLAEGMTVKDLSDKLEVKVKDVLKKLLEKRMMLTINSTLDTETAIMIAREFGADVQMRSFEEELIEVESEDARPEDIVTRAPVVTVMGHVDHGKTTLLDAIRETRVAEREAGGITQHIGAYAVDVNDRKVVFLDTPGHEAFTMMRARGARVTDVVILVVAADDGVMPQTREAIDHSRAAGVPIIVAINKIDKPEANAERVKRELTDLGLMPEDWGGQTVMVPVSAKKREGLELLLEMVLLVTEIAELKANPMRAANGTVLEAKIDKGRGPVATVLVQDGTLRVGDNFIAGVVVGKVRALIDDRGRQVREAGPSTPVEVLGLPSPPQPGDTFQAIEDVAKARQIVLFRQIQAKEKALGAKSSRLTLESLRDRMAEGEVKELPIVIKADVQGSAEVLADSLAKLSDDKTKIRIIRAGVGAINESDVLLASASNAIVIGFNVRPDRNAIDVAERESVDVRLHSVIYNVTDEVKKAMEGMLEPTFKEVRLGLAEVRQLFKVPKAGTVAGCMVVDGVIKRSGDAQARLLRDNVVVYEGKLGSLRRFKEDVSEVKNGFECGISFERFNDLKVGDTIEAFVVERVAAAAS